MCRDSIVRGEAMAMVLLEPATNDISAAMLGSDTGTWNLCNCPPLVMITTSDGVMTA